MTLSLCIVMVLACATATTKRRVLRLEKARDRTGNTHPNNVLVPPAPRAADRRSLYWGLGDEEEETPDGSCSPGIERLVERFARSPAVGSSAIDAVGGLVDARHALPDPLRSALLLDLDHAKASNNPQFGRYALAQYRAITVASLSGIDGLHRAVALRLAQLDFYFGNCDSGDFTTASFAVGVLRGSAKLLRSNVYNLTCFYRDAKRPSHSRRWRPQSSKTQLR